MKPPEPPPAAFSEELPDSPIASVARALPPGARLEEFEVGEVIGEGSAVIVYAASDRARAVPVAIAEYMPVRLAQRNHEAQVTPRTSAQADAFAKGLKTFIKESRTLARCFHPSLVRIARLWEANGTAYRVMPRYPSTRLLEMRRGMNEPPDEKSVRALLDALLGALGVFHQAGGGHGKVTPSNILLLADDRPLLLGPGAAGRAIAGDRIDALMTSGEPSFAPIEQMVESADFPLHPSVDLYALANVARYWISGELPAPVFGAHSTPRRERLADTVQRLRSTWPRLHYSASLLDALDSALSIYPTQRPQDVAQMRARLGTAPAAAGGPMSAARTAVPALNDAVANDAVPNDAVPNDAMPSAPAPAPQPAPPGGVTQDFDVVIASTPDLDPLATSGLARINDDASVRTAFAREVRSSRRIAKWSSAILMLLALLLVGVFEFGQEGQVERVLDALGISHGTAVENSAAVSTPAAGPAAPALPPMVADTAGTKPMTTEPTAADSPPSATAPASPADAPTAADAGSANPRSTETTAAESAPSAAAPASPASSSSATLSAATPASSAEPPAIARPPPAAITPSPTRSAQQHAERAPASPREVCGPRTQFSLYRCMKTQCSQRRWASHAQCQRLRTTDSVD
jgi:non-specific serine/threonine protein kinase